MKGFLFFVSPIIIAILAFSAFSFFLSSSLSGKGALQVTSFPQSNVYLNGKLIGKTPLCKCEGTDMVPSGDYTLKLVPLIGDNLLPYEQKVTITKSILTVVDRTFGIGAGSSGSVISLTPLQGRNTTELFVTSFPSDVAVVIDGNTSGKTPLLTSSLTASDHEVTLSKSGYQDKTIHIHTVAGFQLNALITLSVLPLNATESAAFNQPASISASLKQKVLILNTPTGFLRVRVNPTLNATEEAQIKPGETYEYVDERTGWIEIKLSNGKTGWVSDSYIQKQ